MGNITLELYSADVPETTANFLTLAAEGVYDGTRFHRVIDGFMIQGGDPLSKDLSMQDNWGRGGPGYSFPDEFVPGKSNVTGTIAMANSGPNTNGSQFFINLVDNTFLDYDKEPLSSGHAVFGEVVEGMDVVEAIGKVEVVPGSNRPVTEIMIEQVIIEATEEDDADDETAAAEVTESTDVKEDASTDVDDAMTEATDSTEADSEDE